MEVSSKNSHSHQSRWTARMSGLVSSRAVRRQGIDQSEGPWKLYIQYECEYLVVSDDEPIAGASSGLVRGNP